MKRPIKHPFCIARACAWLCLLLAACLPGAAALAQPASPVTDEGFDAFAKKNTFYAPVHLDGIIGHDCPTHSVHMVLKAASENDNIRHAVFMIDSESGWLLESDHIGVFQGKLTIAAVVRNALAPAICPTFYADHVFMTQRAVIGGLPLHAYTVPGSQEVAAKMVGIDSSMLASAAQARGHDPAIAYAMIDHNKPLFAWEEAGKTVLANSQPGNPSGLDNFRRVEKALPSSVLVIDRETAVRIGFAKPIDKFDHHAVGPLIGEENWHPANRFDRVAFEIGMVNAELEPLRKAIDRFDQLIPEITPEMKKSRSTEIRGYIQFKRSLDSAVDDLKMITNALDRLYEVHPERQTYFRADDGRTVVANPEKWKSDLNEAKKELGLATAQVRRLTAGFRKLGGDEEYLYQVNRWMDRINEHLRGIEEHGNAGYWQDHAKPDVPEDIYG